MAPSLVASYQVLSAGADQTTLTTTSFSPADKEVIIARAATWDHSNGMSTPTDTSGMTWHPVQTVDPGVFSTWAGLWYAVVSGTPGSITVSCAPATAVNTRHSLFVERWSGAQMAASPATNAITHVSGASTETVTLTTVKASSVVSWVAGDASSQDPALTTFANTSGTPTRDGLYDGHLGSNSVHYGVWQDAAVVGSQTFGMTNSGGTINLTIVGVEIQAASITADATSTITASSTAAGLRTAHGDAASTVTASSTATPQYTANGSTTSQITASSTASAAASFTTGTTSQISVADQATAVVSGAHDQPARHGVTGWDLYSTLAEQAAYIDYYRTVPPTACPRCGWPLQQGPPDSPGVRYCPHGDFEYPRDWDPDTMGGL